MSLLILVQLGLISLLAFYVAWNLGANDVANSMGTSVGSKAITLSGAIAIAGILEFTGAVFFGHQVAATLATEVVEPTLFRDNPQIFLMGMVSVLIACGLWLQIATSQGLPVASSHAVVGALAGFSWLARGSQAIDWSTIGSICLAWIIAPVMSGAIAAIFYSLVRRWILTHTNSLAQLREWIPWFSSILLGIFGTIVLPNLLDRPLFNFIPVPSHTLSVGIGGIATASLSWFSWQQLSKQRLKRPEPERQIVEKTIGKFQVISACFVAFAHGSNDVGNAIAPLAAIVYVIANNSVPLTKLDVPLWILVLGGLGIVAGLAIQGKKVLTTIGENIITLVPSTGFCAEIATATTILLASRLGLPVSTSHALVGGVVGIGLIRKGAQVRWETVKSVILAWVVTLPAAAVIGAISFTILKSLL
ncbi:MAG: inorganic phosphate transporter [Xenococcaceae cyanobacterium]